MSNPDRQHFIPQSYLKSFSHQVKDKRFVDILNLESREIIRTSTKKICVKTGLYTMPKAKDPYYLEKYYAENIDAVYPEIYELLVNKNITKISSTEKHKIIYALLSLFFRTPRFLHGLNSITDRSIDKALHLSDKDDIIIDFDGTQLKFQRSKVEEVKAKMREENRQSFLSTQIQKWHEFVRYKYHCGLSVFEIKGDVDLITSDNPVLINSVYQNRFHLFDPTNIIKVPLDRRHFLIVFPNTEEAEKNEIYRGTRDQFFAVSLNWKIEKMAEKLIIGFPGTIEQHLTQQKTYNEPNEKNEKAFQILQQKAKLMSDLVPIIETNGFYSQVVSNKIKEYRSYECFKEDTDLEFMILELAKAGYLTI